MKGANSAAGHTERPPTSSGQLAGQFGWLSAGNILASLLQALAIALLARWVGPDQFGIVSAILALAYVSQTVTDLGIPVYIMRTRAIAPMDSSIRVALRVNAITSFVLGVIVAITIPITCKLTAQTELILALLPLALWAPAERNSDVWLGMALADGRAQVNSISVVARRLALLAAFSSAYLMGMNPLLAYCAASCVVAVATNFWIRRRMQKSLPAAHVESSRASTVISNSRAYWVNSIATHGRNLDVIIVGALAGANQAGLYAAASRVTGPLRILPTSLATVLIPAVARNPRAASFVKPVITVLVSVSVLYGAVVLIAPIAVPIILGPQFIGAILPLQIVVGGLILSALSAVLGAYLQAIGRPNVTATAAVTANLACLGVIALVAPWWGAIGAALALAFSFVVQTAILVSRFKRVPI